MANISASEQLMLELINRARLDPAREAQRLGIDLNQGLAAGTVTVAPKQPLVLNDRLIQAARDHSKWQLDFDIFSHTGAGDSTPGQRMESAGYVFSGSWSWGENISWRGTLPGPIDPNTAVPLQHDGLFLSPGHRTNILSNTFRQIGIGQVVGTFTQSEKNWSASMVTQNFALSGDHVFLTGVVYRDGDGDGLYGLGEGLGQRQISFGTTQVSTNAFGGYESVIPRGVNRITLPGADPIVVEVQVDSQNLKLDLDGNTVKSSVSLTLLSGAAGAELLGCGPNSIRGGAAAENLVGNRGANLLLGNGGQDRLNGGAGKDTLKGGAAADTLWGGTGNDRLLGGAGNDTVVGGAGSDVLTGDDGADVFKFVTIADGTDTLTDFTSATDRIRVVRGNFSNLPLGILAADRLKLAGAALTSADAVFLYDGSSGLLSFDSNGNGVGGVSTIATLTGPKTLVAGDIQIVAS